VGMPARPGIRLEKGHVVPAAEDMRGRQARHPASDDGDVPPFVSTPCWAR